MSRSIHFISRSIPGCGPPDGIPLPFSGDSGKSLNVSTNTSHGGHKLISDVKFLSLRPASRYTSTVCNASSSNYKRNPDFSRQNKHGFSRHRNRHNETREEYEGINDSETLSSRNGPVLSFAGNQKFQATATPGPREKEIVELFRKVQAQLRERAATKEGSKMEESQQKHKESDTVDSLLKLLRKHSVQQGKKSSSIGADNRDFILDDEEKVGPSTEARSPNISMKNEMQESPKPNLTRPKSNFRKRSPVPEIKFRTVYSDHSDLEPEVDDDIQQTEYDSDTDVGPLMLENEINETENDDVAKEEDAVEVSDLHGMKLTELRALAKSRGMKGYSKLKKNELLERLSRSI